MYLLPATEILVWIPWIQERCFDEYMSHLSLFVSNKQGLLGFVTWKSKPLTEYSSLLAALRIPRLYHGQIGFHHPERVEKTRVLPWMDLEYSSCRYLLGVQVIILSWKAMEFAEKRLTFSVNG